MSLKATNKYLFNETVNCEECKHILLGHLCGINPMPYVFNANGHSYYSCYGLRRIGTGHPYNDRPDNGVSYFCGPLGKYFEKKN